MTAQAFAGMVAAGGVAEVVNAALTVLADIAMGIGSLIMLSFALFTVTYLLARLAERKQPLNVVIAPMLTKPETVIDDALPMFFEKRERLHVVRDTTAGADWDD